MTDRAVCWELQSAVRALRNSALGLTGEGGVGPMPEIEGGKTKVECEVATCWVDEEGGSGYHERVVASVYSRRQIVSIVIQSYEIE